MSGPEAHHLQMPQTRQLRLTCSAKFKIVMGLVAKHISRASAHEVWSSCIFSQSWTRINKPRLLSKIKTVIKVVKREKAHFLVIRLTNKCFNLKNLQIIWTTTWFMIVNDNLLNNFLVKVWLNRKKSLWLKMNMKWERSETHCTKLNRGLAMESIRTVRMI